MEFAGLVRLAEGNRLRGPPNGDLERNEKVSNRARPPSSARRSGIGPAIAQVKNLRTFWGGNFSGIAACFGSPGGPSLAQELAPGGIYRGPCFVAHYHTTLIAPTCDQRMVSDSTTVADKERQECVTR
jgi:hypothetical protein